MVTVSAKGSASKKRPGRSKSGLGGVTVGDARLEEAGEEDIAGAVQQLQAEAAAPRFEELFGTWYLVGRRELGPGRVGLPDRAADPKNLGRQCGTLSVKTFESLP